MWFGADPGGASVFGVATLGANGSFKTSCVSSAHEALKWFAGEPQAIGIDCPLWWSSQNGASRWIDKWLRKTYGIRPGTVQSANSLQGAVLIQGLMLALESRKEWPGAQITEAHPKALCKALKLPDWQDLVCKFGLCGEPPGTEHERDALLAAVAAREGSLGRWICDLAETRHSDDYDVLQPRPFYWWPDAH